MLKLTKKVGVHPPTSHGDYGRSGRLQESGIPHNLPNGFKITEVGGGCNPWTG